LPGQRERHITWSLGNVAPTLLIVCFFLLMVSLSQLARIQKEAIAHLRRASADEADRIYRGDYSDGDGASFSWGEMREYCRGAGETSRLRFWVWAMIVWIGGGIGSIFLDQALR
jgi:hypothetical protein